MSQNTLLLAFKIEIKINILIKTVYIRWLLICSTEFCDIENSLCLKICVFKIKCASKLLHKFRICYNTIFASFRKHPITIRQFCNADKHLPMLNVHVQLQTGRSLERLAADRTGQRRQCVVPRVVPVGHRRRTVVMVGRVAVHERRGARSRRCGRPRCRRCGRDRRRRATDRRRIAAVGGRSLLGVGTVHGRAVRIEVWAIDVLLQHVGAVGCVRAHGALSIDAEPYICD